MAINSKYDFVGGYQDDVQGGLLHVANHNVSPGKKQWTWGNGDFGVAWDRNLTDEDGPYIELMTGVYTDNQPDFTWLQPYEEKSWVQYFMPYSQVGYVKNANKDIVFNIEVDNHKAEIIVYTTSLFENIRLELRNTEGKILFDQIVTTSPDKHFAGETVVGAALPEELMFTIYDSKKNILLSYQADKPEIKPTPEPAQAAKQPKEIASIEELFLTGHHLEQYRHATYNPLDYYFEALEREPSDWRCNNAVGLLMLRRGRFEEAEKYLRQAVKTVTRHNPNPYEGEALYNLGWALKMQGKTDEAYTKFFKSTWNAAWQDSGYMGVAQIDALRKDWPMALDNINRSLVRNWHNHKARQVKVSILRKMNRRQEALQLVDESLLIDGLNMGVRFEKYLLTGNTNDLNTFKSLMRNSQHSYIEYSLDYAAVGLFNEAIDLLSECLVGKADYPIVHYAMGYYHSQEGRHEECAECYTKAATLCPDKCFPNRIEEVVILQHAIQTNPLDSKAPYYLGNFFYAARQYELATKHWEVSAQIDNSFPTVLRNLALAYFNKLDDKPKSKQLLERAFELDATDARLFMELDQLYKKLGFPHEQRLNLLEEHRNLVESRDDLYIEMVTLLNHLGRYKQAMEMIDQRTFHPWEGGEGKIAGQYILCRVELAKIAISAGRYNEALNLLNETQTYPHNLGEGKLSNAEENEIDYYKGLAYKGLGEEHKSIDCFMSATKGSTNPVQAFFYNDQQPDKIFYQGLAWNELGQHDKARSRFNSLISHGEKHLFESCKIDFFAVSLPDLVIWEDDLNIRNQAHCYYVMALGYSGLGDETKAEVYYSKVKTLDINKQMFRK